MTKLMAEAGRIPQAGIDIAEVAMAAVVELAVTDVVAQRPPGGPGTHAHAALLKQTQPATKKNCRALGGAVPIDLKKTAGPNPTPHHASLPI
jgi:hypothetical protein